MAERFLTLFRFPANIYAQGSPVVLEAGALLKDSKTQRILAQLKFRNISEQEIKGARIHLILLGIDGEVIVPDFEYSYLDLIARRGDVFGSRVPVFMPYSSVRAIKLAGMTVFFLDGTSYSSDASEWTPLPAQQEIGTFLNHPELLKQWHIEVGANSNLVPVKNESLFRCTCGAINLASSENCYFCSRDFNRMQELLSGTILADHVAVRLRREEEYRIAEEIRRRKEEERRRLVEERLKQELEEQERQRKTRAKKALRNTLISLAAAAVLIAGAIVFFTVALPKIKYNKAMALIGEEDYESGYALLEELGEFDEIRANKRARAMKLIESEAYDKAYDMLAEIHDFDAIAENKIDRAIKRFQEEDNKQGFQFIQEVLKVDGFSESVYVHARKVLNERVKELMELAKFDEVSDFLEVGNTISFGHYEQDNDISNGKEPIEWFIIEKDNNKLFLLSKYALDCKPYEDSFSDWKTEPINKISWEFCSLRKWLNGEFYRDVFSSGEKEKILETSVIPDKDNDYYIPGYTIAGRAVFDLVFILSAEETEKYEASAVKACIDLCKGTKFCHAQGAYKSSKGACRWLLRTPLWFFNDTDYDDSKIEVQEDQYAVRPAMWISLEP